MAYTAMVTDRSLTDAGNNEVVVSIDVIVSEDGAEVFSATVQSVVNKATPNIADVVKNDLEQKLLAKWMAFQAQLAVVENTEALDTLCATIIGDVENYLNQ